MTILFTDNVPVYGKLSSTNCYRGSFLTAYNLEWCYSDIGGFLTSTENSFYFLYSQVLAGNGLVSRLPKYLRLIQSKLTHFLPSKLCPTLTLLLILKKRITSSTLQKANLRLLLTHYSQPIYSWCNFFYSFHFRSVSISSCFFSILCSCLVNFYAACELQLC